MAFGSERPSPASIMDARYVLYYTQDITFVMKTPRYAIANARSKSARS